MPLPVQARKERRVHEAEWACERRDYGRTPKGEWVDEQQLSGLLALGYEKRLAAEVLRRCARGSLCVGCRHLQWTDDVGHRGCL